MMYVCTYQGRVDCAVQTTHMLQREKSLKSANFMYVLCTYVTNEYGSDK